MNRQFENPVQVKNFSEALLVRAQKALLRGNRSLARLLANEILSIDPNEATALHLLGLVEAREAHYALAIEDFQRALNLNASHTKWWNDLGITLTLTGDWKGAAEAFSKVVDHSPPDFIAFKGCGQALLELGDTEPAVNMLRHAVRLRPDSITTIVSLAQALAERQHFNDAVDLLFDCITAQPNRIELYRALASIYGRCGEDELARTQWETALRLAPDDAEALSGLVCCCWELGDLRSTLAFGRLLVESGRATTKLHAFWLYLLLYDDRESAATIKRACAKFGQRISPTHTTHWPSSPTQDPNRQLRIGYLTGEFRVGAAFHFLAPLLANHDKANFEIFFYHTRDRFDHRTEWYRQLGQWRDCREWNNLAIKGRIQGDVIDILVDLSGFFPENRLEIFAERAAPVQVSYPNCPVTTGVSAIDYIFTDLWTCPPGYEDQYTEQPIYLPSGYLAYLPPEDAPELGSLPANRNGVVTFGLFQRRAKMNAGVWDAIAKILQNCPKSRLIIQNLDPTLDDPASSTRRRLIGEFTNRGIAEHRLSLFGARVQAEVMSLMSETDVALDTFPYQGQTTTCECLWMGVPVVAVSGKTHAARVGSAILERVGLGHLAAAEPVGYVRRALELAGDLTELARLRAGMRNRLIWSTLLDGRKLAREVEAEYRRIWTAWCQQTSRV